MRHERIGLVLLMGMASGSSVVVTRIGLQEIAALPLVLLRLTVASSAFVFTLLLLKRSVPQDWRTRRDITIIGLSNMGLPLVLFTLSLQFISSGVLTIFLALIPLFTGILAHLWVHERFHRLTIAGLLVAFSGVLLLVMTRTTGLGDGNVDDIRGHILACGGSLSVAFAAVYTRRQLQGTDVVVLTAGQMMVGMLAVLPFALLLGEFQPALVTWRGWFAVLYSGIIGSFLAFLVFFQLIRRYGATTAALPGYVTPVVSLTLGTLLLDEVVTSSLIIGALLTLAGVFLASR